SIEAHLFEADGDFYGKHVRVEFISFLRDTRKFGSVEELVAQLRKDREHALRALTPFGVPDNLKGSTRTATPTSSVA
ncbi:MAG: riboflavin kinase, partial [Gemmatimonadota bacterium]|nr:riboflavin kinase [Gemmatimonadota bacterium]